MGILFVGIAEMKVARGPDIVTTLGLGSCVGVTLYDPRLQIGGLVHVLLPSSGDGSVAVPAKYADSGIPELADRLLRMGASRNRLVAKIAGGANMFSSTGKSDVFRIGQRNAEMCSKVLAEQKIRLVFSDTGGNYGRTIELDTGSGRLLIKTIGHGIRYA